MTDPADYDARMATVSGRWVRPGLLQPEEVALEDIAWHLAGIARFGGAGNPQGYTVAEHSVRVAERVSWPHRAQALLHDAAEAYLGDVIRPLKVRLTLYRSLEAQAWDAVSARFGLSPKLCSEVEIADERMLATEWRDLMTAACPRVDGTGWRPAAEPYPREEVEIVNPLTFNQARIAFLGLADEVGLK